MALQYHEDLSPLNGPGKKSLNAELEFCAPPSLTVAEKRSAAKSKPKTKEQA